MQRGAESQYQRRAGGEIHALRQRHDPFGGHDAFLGEAAEAGKGDDAVAGLQSLHAFADFLDQARHFSAGREGQRRLDLVEALHHQRIREIECRSP